MIETAERDFPNIKVRYLISINRQAGTAAAREALELAILHRKYLAGLELSGDPRVGNFHDYIEVLEAARSEHGLKVSLHCAECEEQIPES